MVKENTKICVYAICKNESKFVEKWIRNMSEADYICILDTGSTDDTVDKIHEMINTLASEGCKCKIILDSKIIDPWRFDTARNESLLLCPEDTDVFVCTDFDELLNPGWSKPIRQYWDSDKYDRIYYMYTWSHRDNGESGRIFVYDKIHGKNLWWKFPVHECLCHKEDLSVVFDRSRALNLTQEIMLEHFPDRTKSRSSYLPLLELRAKEYPEDTWGLMYLAHEYNYRGFHDKSTNVLNTIINREDFESFTTIEKASCYLFRGDNSKEQKRFIDAISDYLVAITIEPTLREPYLKLASLYTDIKEYDSAIRYAKMAIKNGVRHYSWLEKDYSWSYEPYDILSIASFYGGYKRDALAYAYKAYTFDTNNKRLENNIDLILKNMSDNEFLN